MTWSASDLATIKAAIQADTTADGYITAGNPGACAAYLNAVPASNPTMVTRTDVPAGSILPALVASEVLALTAAQLTLLQLVGLAGTLDFTEANIADGLTAIFPSTTKTYANVMALAQRPASRLEALFTVSGVCSHYGATIDVPTLIQVMRS